MMRSPTQRPKAGPSWPTVVESMLLAVVLAVLALRVTITEAPPVRASTLSINRYDQAYSLIVSCVLIGCIVFGFLMYCWSGRGAGFLWGLGLFLAAGIAGCFIASDKRLAINQVVVSVAPMGLALLLGRMLDQAWKRRLVLALIAALAVAGSFQCLNQSLYTRQAMISQYQSDPNSMLGTLGIEQGTLQEFLFEHRLISEGASGYFTTRNSAGSFAVLALFAAMALFLDKQAGQREPSHRTKAIILYATVAGFIILGLALTRSKGAVLGLAVAGMTTAILVRWGAWIGTHKRRLAILVLAVCAAGIVAIACYGVRHGRLPGGPSMLVRWQYWHAAGRMIADHPWLGVGPGNFAVYYNLYKPAEALESVADPHNFVFSLLAQYGPVGLIGFLLLAWSPLRRAFATGASGTAGDTTSEPAPQWALGICATAVAVAMFLVRPWVSTLLNSGDAWSSPYAALVSYVIPGVLILVGLVLLSEGPRDHDKDRSTPPRKSYVTVFLGAGIMAVLAANLIDYALFEPAIATCFWAIVGCLTASSRDWTNSPMPACSGPTISDRRAWAMILAYAGILVACWFWAIGPVLETSCRMEQARQAIKTGDFDRARRLLDQAIAADRLSATAPSTQGRVYLEQYLRQGRKDPTLLSNAVQCLVLATQRNPVDFRDYERLGDAYDLLYRSDQAYQAYQDAARRYPGCDRLWLRLGQTAEKCGKARLAAGHYAKAIAIEDAFRRQFAAMYPGWKKPVSRLGQENYQYARQRLRALAPTPEF